MVIGFKKQFEAPIKAGTKIHTIREDAHDRWKPGMMMHQATGVRTKYYRCFNETPCISTQRIIMLLEKDDEGGLSVLVMKIGQRKLAEAEQEQLAVNDGFLSLYEFKKWWYPELAKQPDHYMVRKIIHWTNFRY